jgi:adenine-specific DNA-methyltransferase
MPTLHWIGKDKVINHHMDVPYRILEHRYRFKNGKHQNEPDNNASLMEHSDGAIIHGDNLEALKSLLPEYEGRVKCIYIDPPYNTGNEGWVYNDNVNDPKIKKWLGKVVGKESDDLSRHDKWLCMMYPRLKLLHKLLSKDGAIFISIDDNEQPNLKLICDEVFGGNNFVDNLIWEKIFSPKNSAKYFSANHDFIVVYAKSKELWNRNPLKRTKEQDSRYKNPDNDPRGPWTSGDLSARNPYSLGRYPIEAPGGRIIKGPPKGTYWRFSKEKFTELDQDSRIWWGQEKNNVPRLKRFLSEIQEGVVPKTIWLHTEVGNTQDAKKEFNKILFDGELKFDTPKPVKLIERVLEIASDKNDIILDSFAGSGTTAHAVLNLNKQDGGSRKFILVEMEDYAENITAERVKRVIKGYGSGNKQTEGTGGSFDYYELGQPLFIDEDLLNEDVELEKIRQYVWFSETHKPYKAVNQSEEHLLGVSGETAYYFYYFKNRLTTLDDSFLRTLKTKAGQYIIYADLCVLDSAIMQKYHITFKKIPRDITRF